MRMALETTHRQPDPLDSSRWDQARALFLCGHDVGSTYDGVALVAVSAESGTSKRYKQAEPRLRFSRNTLTGQGDVWSIG